MSSARARMQSSRSYMGSEHTIFRGNTSSESGYGAGGSSGYRSGMTNQEHVSVAELKTQLANNHTLLDRLNDENSSLAFEVQSLKNEISQLKSKMQKMEMKEYSQEDTITILTT